MKTISKFLTTALITTTLAAAPAMAGSVGTTIGAEADINLGSGISAGASGDVTAAGQAGSQDNVGALIKDNAAVASEIQTMTNADAVTVVKVSSTADASDGAIDDAVKENREAVDSLQTSLRANAALSGKLEAEGVNISNVVTAKAGADGALTVYVR